MTDDFGKALDKFRRDVEEKVKRVTSRESVPITEVLSPAFISSVSQFADFEAFCAAAGVTTAEEFQAFPEAEWEAHVRANTRFESWMAMQSAGHQHWLERQLK